jgi:hypothetical protein
MEGAICAVMILASELLDGAMAPTWRGFATAARTKVRNLVNEVGGRLDNE